MKALIGKLTTKKDRLVHLLPNFEEGPERNYQRKDLERVCMMLNDARKSYFKTEKNWRKILKQAETCTLKIYAILLER
jgi:hypothetical protein